MALKDRATDRGASAGGGEAVERGRLAEALRDGVPQGPPLGQGFHWFTHAGPVLVDEEDSAPYEPEENQVLVAARARLAAAGESTTSVDVKVNGSVVGTVSWAAGQTLATPVFEEFLEADADLLAVRTTAAGEGASGISIRFEFTPA
jgi:hypothetical protein